jgi:hypothetical protein
VAGTLATFVSEHPEEGNLANFAQDLGMSPNVVLEALDVDGDDTGLEARLKNSVTDGAIAGLITDTAIAGVAAAIRQIKPAVQARRAAKAITEVPDEALAIPPKAAPAAPRAATPPAATPATPKEPRVAPKEAAEDVGLKSEKIVAPETAAKVDPVDEMVASIPERVRALSPEDTRALAEEIAKDVDRTLQFRINFDPTKIDWADTLKGGQEGVEKVVRLVKAVGEGADDIARSAGSEPQSWGETAKAAAALGGRGFRIIGELAEAGELAGDRDGPEEPLAGQVGGGEAPNLSADLFHRAAPMGHLGDVGDPGLPAQATLHVGLGHQLDHAVVRLSAEHGVGGEPPGVLGPLVELICEVVGGVDQAVGGVLQGADDHPAQGGAPDETRLGRRGFPGGCGGWLRGDGGAWRRSRRGGSFGLLVGAV